MENIIKDARSRMDKTLEALRSELVKVRTGKQPLHYLME
jgi:ribosome recycling factor